MTSSLTPKAQRTRAQLLDTALELFADQGYASTTMRQIAQRSGRSTGLIYRYFDRKESLVMALYERLAHQLHQHVFEDLPAGGSLGARFGQAMRWKMEGMQPHKETLGAMFASMFETASPIGVFSGHNAPVRRVARQSFAHVVREADDVPDAMDHALLGDVLYMAHLLVVLVWLLDQTPDSRATHRLIDLSEQALVSAWPVLRMILGLGAALAQLSAVFEELEASEEAP